MFSYTVISAYTVYVYGFMIAIIKHMPLKATEPTGCCSKSLDCSNSARVTLKGVVWVF